jgi:hypothetical protein
MKSSLQSSLNRRARIAWQCVGLFLFFAGVAAAQEAQSVPGKQPGSLPPAATFADRVSAVEQVQFDVVMVVLPYDGLDEWAKKHDADIKRIDVKSGQPAHAKPALQFEPEVRQALLTKLKGNPAAALMHFPAAVTVWGREVRVDTGVVPEEEGGMNVRLTPTQIGKGELRLKIAAEFHLSEEMQTVVPPTNWNLNLRTRANSTFLLPLAELGGVQRIVLLIQPKIVAPVRATILGTPQVVQPHKVTGWGPPAHSVTTGVSTANIPAAPAFLFQPATDPSTSTRAGYPAPPGQQVHLEVLFAVVPDEVLMKWAIPHKAIIKRVHSNERRPTPLRKPAPAASRQFSLLFGSEAPVPLLFDAELRESLLTALKKDTRTKLLRGTSVMTAWGHEVSVKTPLGVKEKTPLALRMLPTEIGKGELGLVIDAEVSSTPDVPGGMKSHWNVRARAGHTLMLPLAQPDLEKQLVLFVVPKIIGPGPATPYPTPQIAGPLSPESYQPVLPTRNQMVYPQPYQAVPRTVYPQVPITGYQPIPQTSYRPVPRTTVAGTTEKDVATLQMLILDVDAKIAREVVSEIPKQEEKLSKVDIQLPKEKGSKKPDTRKRKVETRSFVMNSSLGKLFIADLKKQDESFKVISRPQMRTLVGVGLALEIHGGKDPAQPVVDLLWRPSVLFGTETPTSDQNKHALRAQQVAGVGTLKIFVTPKEVDGQLVVRSLLTLLGPGKSLRPEEWTQGLKIEAEFTQRGVPGETAVMMLGGKECERTIILLTDLVHLEKGKPRSTPPVAQVQPVPPRSTAGRGTVMQQWQQAVSPYAPTLTWKPAPSTNMRLVTLQGITGSSVVPGDTVDVLLACEDGDPAKFKVEPICESVTVHSATKTSDDCTTVTLLVDKSVVATLLLGEIKGTLRLSLHKSTVQHRNQGQPAPGYPNYISTLPNYGQPVSPYRGSIVYRENGTWGPPDTPIQASGVQSPQPKTVPVRQKAKSEVQQVLDEVREMRKMI